MGTWRDLNWKKKLFEKVNQVCVLFAKLKLFNEFKLDDNNILASLNHKILAASLLYNFQWNERIKRLFWASVLKIFTALSCIDELQKSQNRSFSNRHSGRNVFERAHDVRQTALNIFNIPCPPILMTKFTILHVVTYWNGSEQMLISE